MVLTRSTHFKTWANEENAPGLLPLLVRRLVRSIAPNQSFVNFPAKEQVHRPGFDGIVEVTRSIHQFVPQGKSAWEMGVNGNFEKKANDDFKTRTENTADAIQRETTFVFVTPREWQKKDEWAQSKKSSSSWKDIIVLDCNDLEHWIELCPAVDVWFSIENGRRPRGIVDLSHRWDALSKIAAHPLSHDIFLSGRDTTCCELLKWFEGDPRSLLLSSSSVDDSFDFLAAFVSQNSKDSSQLERMFVMDDVEAWRQLAIGREPLILVAKASLGISSADVQQAVSKGHHVLIVGKRAASQSSPELEIPRQECYLLANSLRECGFDEATASSKAKACCGSSTILKRMITKHPDVAFPEWSQGEYRNALAPFALIGGWQHLEQVEPDKNDSFPGNSQIDLICLQDFMGLPRETLETAVGRWSDCDQPLFLSFRNNIVITSREDAWYLLANAITPITLERFEDLASLVLEEDDPALEMESDKRWLANIYGKTLSLSSEIRRGILETLALMATYPISGIPAMNVDFKAAVRRVLSRILPEGASWQRWATFDRELVLFAEADPDFLLSRLEADLNSNYSQIALLFEQSNTEIYGRTNYHCGLLWALETIAWSPEYLTSVTRVLGRLMEIENRLPSNLRNRPSESLRTIFLWWLPHTNATIPQRIASLNRLAAEQPETAWSLTLKLIPTNRDTLSNNSAQPRWREWAIGWTRDNARQDSQLYANAIADFVLSSAGEDPHKWSQILEGILMYNPRVTTAAFEVLDRIAENSTDIHGRSEMWTELNQLIIRHEKFPEADWTAPKEILVRIRAIRELLKPNDPVVLNQWIFTSHVELPDVDISNCYEVHQATLNERRLEALRQICDQQGHAGITRLMKGGADGHAVGWILGRDSLVTPMELGIANLISSNDSESLRLADSFLGGSFETGGFGAIKSILGSLSSDQQAFALVSCRQERTTWDWIDANCSEEVQTAFWKKVNRVWDCVDLNELNHVINKLLVVKRAFTAADVVYMASIRGVPLDVDLAFRVLQAGQNSDLNDESIERIRVFPIQQLIGFLQAANAERAGELLQIEWGYLYLLDIHSSKTRPITLFNAMKNDPNWYVELLKCVVREKGDDSERPALTTQKKNLYLHARKLLDSFTIIPGTKEDGSIVEAELRKWIEGVRRLASQAKRLESADSFLGGLFSKCARPVRPKEKEADGEVTESVADNQVRELTQEELNWPPVEVCRVMEHIGTDAMFNGFSIGVRNNVGVTWRNPLAGGAVERALAAQYLALATHHEGAFHGLASTLRSMAIYLEHNAIREDVESNRERLER